MVKEVVRWEAEDGIVFSTLEGCLHYEAIISKVQMIDTHLNLSKICTADIIEFVEKHTKGWK